MGSEEVTLRRRKHVLERRYSDVADSDSSAPQTHPDAKTPDPMPLVDSSTRFEDDEPESDLSDERDFIPEERPAQPLPTAPRPRRTTRQPSETTELDLASRAWYEFDLAVVAALVSPVGNWLTGGDHVKNIVLVVLLVFYLHQIIEVPWRLYLSSRPRKSSHGHSNAHEDILAHSELRKLELSFLLMTVLSPFFGAALLQYVSSRVLGEDVISWFSTALFVLATGVRPWAHVVKRLSSRVTDLHDVIHYPSSLEPAEEYRSQLEEMKQQIAGFEKALLKMRQKLGAETEELYDYVDDAVTGLEKSVKRHDKRGEKYETRLKDLEYTVDRLAHAKGKEKPSFITVNTKSPPSGYKSLSSLVVDILPPWLVPAQAVKSPSHAAPRLSPSTIGPKHPPRTPSYSSLETIPEESFGAGFRSTKVAASVDRPPASQPGLIHLLFLRISYIATFPLRSIMRLITNSF